MDLESLNSRLGVASIDGIDQPIAGQNIGYVDAHHILWWERHFGRTDLSNGLVLCSYCHHMIHRDGWRITASTTEVWFIPPPHVDPQQKPRLGGRARFELAAVAA